MKKMNLNFSWELRYYPIEDDSGDYSKFKIIVDIYTENIPYIFNIADIVLKEANTVSDVYSYEPIVINFNVISIDKVEIVKMKKIDKYGWAIKNLDDLSPQLRSLILENL